MGKFITSLMLVFIIELTLFIYQFNVGNTSLLQFLINPSGGSLANFSLYSLFVSNLGTLTIAGAIIATTLFIIRPETVPAGIALAIITFIAVIIHFWTVLASQAVFGDASNIIATMITAPLFIYFLVTVVDYWRKPD